MQTRVVEIRKEILNRNDETAHSLRERLQAAGVLTVNLIAGPGAGKTTFLESSLRMLQARGARTAALVAGLATDIDARRLAQSAKLAKQINTQGRSHLEAQMISDHLADWNLKSFEYLMIENIGNLVCPASYDLGEDVRVVLLSVAEGADAPLKYPKIFDSADVVVITKIDLAEACHFSLMDTQANIEAVRPGTKILVTSARTGLGMETWLDWLVQKRERIRLARSITRPAPEAGAGLRVLAGHGAPGASVLTAREREVLHLVTNGLTTQAIAHHLDISHHTVTRHRANLMEKLKVHSPVELLNVAISRGLVAGVERLD